MKKTTLHPIHKKLDAKMVEFGGFEMPVSYSSIKEEHCCVRENVGVFDVSHMGEFFVEGDQALPFLQWVCSNDIALLQPGKAQYNYFPNEKGGVIDDLIVYCLEAQRYLLVVNASNIEKDWAWLTLQNKNFNAQLTNASEDYSLLAVQGPKALEVVQRLTESPLNELAFYSVCSTTLAGIPNTLVATTGYTGAGGVEIYCKNEAVEKVWNMLFSAGKSHGILPIGLAARDTLRLEMGYCLYGHEIDETTSPIAAGLGWVTRPQTDCINAAALERQVKQGTTTQLVGFEMTERGIPRQDHNLFNLEGGIIGKVTSGTQSPLLKKAIGLGYVQKEWAAIGTQIAVEIRGKHIMAKVVQLPFYRP